MMSKPPLLASLIFALLALTPKANTNELIAAVHTAPPFIIPGDNFDADASEGIDILILKEITENLGISLKFKYCAWHSCLKQIKQGKIDILSFTNKREAREPYLYYLSMPYISENPTAVYTRAEDQHKMTSYEDLLGLERVGLISNAAHFPRLDQDQIMNKVHVNSAEQLYPMLALGRLDAIIVAQRVADHRIKVKGLGDTIKLAFRLSSGQQPLYITLSKKNVSKAVFQAIDEEHSRLINNGRIDEIISLYTNH